MSEKFVPEAWYPCSTELCTVKTAEESDPVFDPGDLRWVQDGWYCEGCIDLMYYNAEQAKQPEPVEGETLAEYLKTRPEDAQAPAPVEEEDSTGGPHTGVSPSP